MRPILVQLGVDNRFNDGLSPFARKSFAENRVGEEERATTLLLHSRKGSILSTNQITCSFKRFIVDYDASLTNVTSMTLRASFATAMFRAFKSGNLFKRKSESFFFEHISALMNTSVEQMRSTYITIDSLDFESSARCVMKAMEKVFFQASDDHVTNLDGRNPNVLLIDEEDGSQRRPNPPLSSNSEFLNM